MALSQLDDRSSKSGPGINPSRVIDRMIRYWYFFAVTLTAGFTGAYLINRYTTKIFPVDASIIIKESEDESYSRFLYGNTILNPERNYSDQFFIMRSYPLMQRVVDSLRLHTSFYVKGDIKSKEFYLPDFPVRFVPAAGSSLPYGRKFQFTFINERQFRIALTNNDDNFEDPVEYQFNDTVALYDKKVLFSLNSMVGRYKGREYEVRMEDPYNVAVRYSAILGLSWSQRGSGVIDLHLEGTDSSQRCCIPAGVCARISAI